MADSAKRDRSQRRRADAKPGLLIFIKTQTMIMKKISIIKNVSLLFCVILLASCYKKFDPKSFQPPFTINGYTSTAEIGQGHLVGYWSFDGSYVDSVSNVAATGVGTSFTGGFKGQALQGAANGYVISNLPNAIKNVNSFTID